MPLPRRRPRRRPERIPHRAARQALTPTHPRAAELFLGQVLRAVAAQLERAIFDVVEPRIADFAAPEPAARTDAAADGGAGGDPTGVIAAIQRVVDDVLARTKPRVEDGGKKAGKRAWDHSKNEFHRLGIKLLEAEPSLGPKIDEWRDENADRIVSLSDQKVDRVRELLENKAGMRVEALRDAIRESVGATKRQAALIARDQVLKINGQITEARHTAAGIDEYIWTCSGDERVRGRPDGLYPDAKPSHWALDGKRFKWSEPPISGPRGERGHPGTMFQCRCTAYPILPELEAEGLG